MGRRGVQVMDTENIDDPFKEAKVRKKVILGGRSMKVFSDNKEVMLKLNGMDEAKPTKSRKRRVPFFIPAQLTRLEASGVPAPRQCVSSETALW